MAIEWILSYLGLGVLVGFLAGLLGIGGGAVMVPLLTALFMAQGVATDQVVHLALGTSMGAIIMTSLSSLMSHSRRGGVLWPVVRTFSPGILLGTFGATFVAAYLSAVPLAIIFAVFIGFASVQMLLNRQPRPGRELPGKAGLFAAGTGIGGISALVSIGGGSLSVPYMIWHNVAVKQAIGTSAALGLPISVAGTLGYLINGWNRAPDALPLTFGFVHLPAVLLISLCSVFLAPLGARLAHRLPVLLMRRLFACLLMALALRMLFSIL